MKYSKIKSIKQVKPSDIYHLSVDKNHNYFANNICVHNCYRGNLGIKLYNLTDQDYKVNKNDRIAQLIVFENYNTMVEFGKVEKTDRGESGFGSSGK